MAEDGFILLAQARGDVGYDAHEQMSEDAVRVMEGILETPEKRRAALEAFKERMKQDAVELPQVAEFGRPDDAFDEVAPAPYPGPQPSVVKKDRWIRVQRLQGEYPEPTARSGKWLVFIHNDKVDALWAKINTATEEGLLGYDSKVSTRSLRPGSTEEHVICVYTYDWKDKEDAVRVRDALRNLGVTWLCSYKTNEDTLNLRYSSSGHRVSKYRM